jgi:nicotinamide-nucleotide amidase
MFRKSVMSILRSLVPNAESLACRVYRITGIGESVVEEAIGNKILAISGIELGYCARPGDVDVRIIGEGESLERAASIITSGLGDSIYSTSGEDLEERMCPAHRIFLLLAM